MPSNQPYAAPPLPSNHSTGPRTSGQAIASLLLGLSSFFCAAFTGILGIIFGVLALNQISSSQGRLAGSGLAIAGIVTGAVGCLWTLLLVGLLLPAVQQVRNVARQTQAMNNVRQIQLAMLNYESAHQHLPPAELTAEAEFGGAAAPQGVGLSWRVAILPFIEEGPLYERFHLDEPWDSPHNLPLADEMPLVYVHPSHELPSGRTVFAVPVSGPLDREDPQFGEKATLFVRGEQGTRFGDITDGSSNTIMVLTVDPSAAVTWTKPDDWEFDPADPYRDLGGTGIGTYIFGMADGSVHRAVAEEDADNMRAMMTRQGGEIVTIQ